MYEHRLSTGELRPDGNQLTVVQQLQTVSDELVCYKHVQKRSGGMLSLMSTVRTSFHGRISVGVLGDMSPNFLK